MSPRNWSRRALESTKTADPRKIARVPVVLGAIMLTGCSLNKDQFRADKAFTRIGGGQGQIIEPKRCMLEVAILTRPVGDKTINSSVWNTADVQCVPEESRKALEANGIRIGKILGALPSDLESALHAPPPHKVEPVSYVPEVNEAIQIRTAVTVPRISLLTSLDNRVIAKDYEQVSGFLRVTSGHEGERGVGLRMIPEIHHGPVKQGFQPIANLGPYPLNQLTISNSQQQDSLQELTTSLVLQPGEVAVISCDAERDGNLGSFLFSFVEANSDRKMQHLILIWASRNKSGTIEADKLHSSADRPKETRNTKPNSSITSTPPKPDTLEPSKREVGLKAKDKAEAL